MDPVSTTKSLYEAFGRGDLGFISNAMHPGIDWISNGDPRLLPWGGKQSGPDAAVKGFFAPLVENIEFLAFEPRTFFGGADFCTVLGFTRGKMKRTGIVWESEWSHLFRYVDGKVILFREFYDTHALVEAYAGRKAA
jgi:ketosteroid isomerase-like protein